MGDCVAAYDPVRDPPDSLYGFTRDEWERAGGPAADVASRWDEVLAVVRAGGGVDVGMGCFVAIGGLSSGHARRAIARLDPAFSQDYARWEAAVAAGARGADLVQRVDPALARRLSAEDAALIADDMTVQFTEAAELIALAGGD